MLYTRYVDAAHRPEDRPEIQLVVTFNFFFESASYARETCQNAKRIELP